MNLCTGPTQPRSEAPSLPEEISWPQSSTIRDFVCFKPVTCPDIIKSNKRLIAGPKVPAKARILRQKCHLRQISVNCDKCDNLHQNSTICIKTALFA